MNWILLIIAGLFEVGFTTCLGKAKITSGNTSLLWLGGFFVSLTLSMYLLIQGHANPSDGNGICSVDGHWRSRNGDHRDHFFQGAGRFLAAFLYRNIDRINRGSEVRYSALAFFSVGCR
jgi:hypothetical protein